MPPPSFHLSIQFSTSYYGPMCARASNSYDWDSSESEGKRLEPTPLPHMRLWFFNHIRSHILSVSCSKKVLSLSGQAELIIKIQERFFIHSLAVLEENKCRFNFGKNRFSIGNMLYFNVQTSGYYSVVLNKRGGTYYCLCLKIRDPPSKYDPPSY